MRHRTEEELLALARKAAERDIARLKESGLPLTPGLIEAMARKAGEEQAMADLSAPPYLQKEHTGDDGIMTVGEYLGTLPAWRRNLSLLVSLIKTRWGYSLFLWVSGYPSKKYRSKQQSHKNADELERGV